MGMQIGTIIKERNLAIISIHLYLPLTQQSDIQEFTMKIHPYFHYMKIHMHKIIHWGIVYKWKALKII